MDIILISTIAMITVCIVLTVALCAKNKSTKKMVESKKSVKSQYDDGKEPDAYVSEKEEILNLNAPQPPMPKISGTIKGIPKLPERGVEMDVPLPKGAKKLTKKGPRPKKVPKGGDTAPIRPVDEDPTMPIEDNSMAYKMAAQNRPVVPIPPSMQKSITNG